MDIHDMALALAQADRDTTESMFGVLHTLERDRSYLEREVSSLHSYCTKIMKLSEGSATRRVNASRLVADVPVSLDMFRACVLNLSHLSMAQAFIQSQENHTGVEMSVDEKMDVLHKIAGKTQDQAKRTLQKELPDAPIGRESMRPVGDETDFTFRADAEFVEMMAAVRAKHGHKPEFASIVGLFKALMRKELTRGHNAGVVSAAKTRAAFRRAGGRCEWVHEGVRCPGRHHLQIDHIIPRSRGGGDDLDNLQVLCRAHNLKKGDRPVS